MINGLLGRVIGILIVAVLIIILVLSFRGGDQVWDEDNIRLFISEQYSGSIQQINETIVDGQTVYEVDLLEATGLYQIVIDPATQTILSLTQLSKRENVTVEKDASQLEAISTEKVREIVNQTIEGDYSDMEITLRESGGNSIYDILVYQEEAYTEIVMDAQTGTINTITLREKGVENEQPPETLDVIGEEEAVRIALTHVAGKVDDVELEEENGRLVYEIEIEVGESEANVYIDAFTGELITIKWED
ncbi:PepSY domain-containing protein [Halalkalibacter akibai]|uniref:PepSY domain-containing protein n=1 Tax=Halalkalibacter akibai (strain ATCC 43226 / DSM 21942 / CIP 109018 / JCM 9157 / 1139) TaxID=1236973 RepID=W4QUR2_HALA3|nr:PepSY domain-containing protein [Halalkalibacter akibai]GAE35637.1 hypothetical protein JCM9157_2754 [Halalkalibacter akibai JCM 9157]